MADLFNTSWAMFSPDRKNRLVLYRCWNTEKPCAMVIGLNPSNAGDTNDDPTIGFIRRCLDFNGYGSFYMVNLFTMITPYPKELLKDDFPEKSMKIWDKYSKLSQDVIFAWGNITNVRGRDMLAKNTFPNALCFHHLKGGNPRHGMYLKAQTKLKKYKT